MDTAISLKFIWLDIQKSDWLLEDKKICQMLSVSLRTSAEETNCDIFFFVPKMTFRSVSQLLTSMRSLYLAFINRNVTAAVSRWWLMRWSRQSEVGSRVLWHLAGICRGKGLLIFLGGGAGNMSNFPITNVPAGHHSYHCYPYFEGDWVPQAFFPDVFVLMEHILRFPLCVSVSDSNRKHAKTEEKP